MKTYTYPKSDEMMRRAAKVIPAGVYGHLGPAEGCFIPIDAYPKFMDHAQGSYFWDVDGNRFIDYMCAYGPNILGYCDEDVDRAAAEQMTLATARLHPPSRWSSSPSCSRIRSPWRTGLSLPKTAATLQRSRC